MSQDIDAQLNELLEKAFAEGGGEYKERGFKRRVGYGTRPAIIHIGMANAWTRPGHQFSCKNMDVIIPACQDLNEAARAKDVPVIFTTTAYDITDVTLPSDMGLWSQKIPVEVLDPSSEAAGDRVSGVVAWNLFDIDAKFGDVEPLANVVKYLNDLPNFADTVPTMELALGTPAAV